MVDAGAGAAPLGPGTPKKAAGQRRLLSLALTIVGGFFFGIVAATAFAAWSRSFLGDVVALLLGFLFAWLVPLVLTLRATQALKKKNRPVLLRRVVAVFLVGLVQLTVFLAGFTNLGQGTVDTSAEMSAAALPIFRHVPVLGGMLTKAATDGGALDPKKPDPKTPIDPTTPTTPTTPLANGLSPRAAGRPIHAFAAGVQTADGDVVVVAWSLAFGGEATPRVIDLASFSALGNPTRVEIADDGGVAVVLGGAQVLTVKAGSLTAEHDKALSRGSRIGDLDIQQVRDIAVAPGGAVLLTVDAFDSKKGAVRQALIGRSPGGVPYAVRKAGDAIDTAEKKGDLQNLAHGYSIKQSDGSGAVVVEEEFLEGETDVGTKLSGPTWIMNARRLLVGQVDNPRALAELVRSGTAPSGVDNVSLQAFGDAALLPDGRCFFDANYIEEGGRGWLFSARTGGGAFAVSPELVGKPEAPFSEKGPRTRHLRVEPEGNALFLNRDGALMLGTVARLQDAKAVLKGEAVRPQYLLGGGGVRAGGIASIAVPRLARGGEWLVASVELLADGGARNKAVVLASKTDLAAGKAEVLLEQGGLVPTPPPPPAPVVVDDKVKKDDKKKPPPAELAPAAPVAPKERRVKSIFFFDGHDEPLWQPG
ncbi:MAG: hypothetical protein Q8O67_16275 [Deltaproteobacteria bacterium]|nr:hypothetical protein [Deltaproteobacteria bacterium]